MEPIRIVWGTGEGPTELAAYDDALAAAGVHEYNLRRLSSVIPADATVDHAGTAPDLGPTGGALDVVEAAATTDGGQVSAALGWQRRPDGSGIFYEGADLDAPDAVATGVLDGLAAGVDRRDGTFGEPELQVASIEGTTETDRCVAAAVLAVYGAAEPIL